VKQDGQKEIRKVGGGLIKQVAGAISDLAASYHDHPLRTYLHIWLGIFQNQFSGTFVLKADICEVSGSNARQGGQEELSKVGGG
jgi:hypothetical protein